MTVMRETEQSAQPLSDWSSYAAFATELADIARPIAMRYFRTPLDVVSKSDESPVTVADRTIEAELRKRIEERYPEHGIFGEEFGVKEGGDFTWVLDPIDGTKSFITGFPLFGTLISLTSGGRPLIGLIDVPATGERWSAVPGQTSFGGLDARTSGCRMLSSARFYTTSPEMFRGDEEAIYARLSSAAGLRRFGGDCYSYGLLASGHCDLILETGLQPYDYMAIVPVVAGAGGCVTDWRGEPLTLRSEGKVLASATPELHAKALALINERG